MRARSAANRKVSTTVYLTKRAARRLARLSGATHKPQAAYIREAIGVMLIYEEQRNAEQLANYDLGHDLDGESEERE